MRNAAIARILPRRLKASFKPATRVSSHGQGVLIRPYALNAVTLVLSASVKSETGMIIRAKHLVRNRFAVTQANAHPTHRPRRNTGAPCRYFPKG